MLLYGIELSCLCGLMGQQAQAQSRALGKGSRHRGRKGSEEMKFTDEQKIEVTRMVSESFKEGYQAATGLVPHVSTYNKQCAWFDSDAYTDCQNIEVTTVSDRDKDYLIGYESGFSDGVVESKYAISEFALLLRADSLKDKSSPYQKKVDEVPERMTGTEFAEMQAVKGGPQ
jgi:hypothetical protein